jgi:cytoskeletal protein CcmA (bactofilin family)
MDTQTPATSTVSTSLVSQKVTIEGDLQGTENIQIDGQIKGSVKLNGDIIIGPTGVVEADVEGNNIIIRGTVKGNVIAREHLEIHSSGNMTGDISARSIDIKEGSSFEGRSRMIKSDRQPKVPVSSPVTADQPTKNVDQTPQKV